MTECAEQQSRPEAIEIAPRIKQGVQRTLNEMSKEQCVCTKHRPIMGTKSLRA